MNTSTGQHTEKFPRTRDNRIGLAQGNSLPNGNPGPRGTEPGHWGVCGRS